MSTQFGLRLKVLLIIAAFSFVAGAATAQPNRRLMKIQHFSRQAQEAYDAKKYDESAHYYKLLVDLAPFDAGMYYNLACSQALAGDTDAALDSLERSIQLGWDDAEWMAQMDEDLASLRNSPKMAELVEHANACRDEQVAVFVPESLGDKPPTAVLVTLHGFTGNARGFSAYWQNAAKRKGMIVVAPRGPVRLGRQVRYAWSEPRARSLKLTDATEGVERAIELARRNGATDDTPIVLVGYSQGASVAISLLAQQPDRFAGAVTFGASVGSPERALWEAMDNESDATPRVCLLVGALDQLVDENKQAVNLIEDAGGAVKLIEIPATAHEIPAEHTDHLLDALKFVLAE